MNTQYPAKARMKHHRRDRTASLATVGGVAGTFIFPVVGTVLGATILGWTTHAYYKRKEDKVQQQWEQQHYQASCDQSSTATGSAVFV